MIVPDLGGVVLCGGRSSRMGTAKAWLDFGGEPGEAIALDDAGSGKPEVLVDNYDLLRRPAKLNRLGGQGILALCRFSIAFDLRRRGLSEINVGGTTQVRSADLGDVIHQSPPCFGLSRRLAR